MFSDANPSRVSQIELLERGPTRFGRSVVENWCAHKGKLPDQEVDLQGRFRFWKFLRAPFLGNSDEAIDLLPIEA